MPTKIEAAGDTIKIDKAFVSGKDRVNVNGQVVFEGNIAPGSKHEFELGDLIIERSKRAIPEVPLLWANLLHSLSATSAYRRKVGPTLEANQLVDFVFTDAQFPRYQTTGFGRYANFKPMSQGGSAVLRTCRDKNLGRIIVMKTLPLP